MRVLGYTVMRNEAHRYLDACLSWQASILDGIAVFDDRSSDGSVDIAHRHGCHVAVREETVPAFMEHEARFRMAAWEWFERTLTPERDDWVLAFDADEFLTGSASVHATCQVAMQEQAMTVTLSIPEVFDVDMTPANAATNPKVRKDGYWSEIVGCRLFRYMPNGFFKNLPMACGAEPSYARTGPFYRTDELMLLHYGYATAADRISKHNRYTGLPGHASSHVQSILESASCVPWEGPQPTVWRGVHLNG